MSSKSGCSFELRGAARCDTSSTCRRQLAVVAQRADASTPRAPPAVPLTSNHQSMTPSFCFSTILPRRVSTSTLKRLRPSQPPTLMQDVLGIVPQHRGDVAGVERADQRVVALSPNMGMRFLPSRSTPYSRLPSLSRLPCDMWSIRNPWLGPLRSWNSSRSSVFHITKPMRTSIWSPKASLLMRVISFFSPVARSTHTSASSSLRRTTARDQFSGRRDVAYR